MLSFDFLRDDALAGLLATLDAIAGAKLLVLERALSATVSRLCGFSVLQSHGVKHVVWLDAPNLRSLIQSNAEGSSALVYLSSTDFGSLTAISDSLQSVLNQLALDLNVILTPAKSPAFELLLDEAGVLGDVTVHEWSAHFVPLASDLLSLGLPSGGFHDLYVSEVASSIHRSAQALDMLQRKYCSFGRILGKGDAAAKLTGLLLRNRQQRQAQLAEQNSKPTEASPQDTFDYNFQSAFAGIHIDQLIIIDRKADMLTPLLTQLTYEGLVDEFYGVSDSGQVDLPTSIVSPNAAKSATNALQSAQTKTTNLDESDTIFASIRDLNFAIVGQTLNRHARRLQSDYDQRHEAKTVSEIKSFVGKLGNLQTVHESLRLHTALAQDLMSKVQGHQFSVLLEIQQNVVAGTMDTAQVLLLVESLIGSSADLRVVLRLLAIESYCRAGIKQKDLNMLKQEILQTYGYKHLQTLHLLEKLHLIYARSPQLPNNFAYLRRHLSLVVEPPDDADELDPPDISYTYSGYAPLSCRLVQCVIDKASVLKTTGILAGAMGAAPTATSQEDSSSTGWKGAEDILKYVAGPTIDNITKPSAADAKENKLRKILVRNSGGRDKANVLVYFLGGITHSELAALRMVSRKSKSYDITVATSGFISGNKIIDVALQA